MLLEVQVTFFFLVCASHGEFSSHLMVLAELWFLDTQREQAVTSGWSKAPCWHSTLHPAWQESLEFRLCCKQQVELVVGVLGEAVTCNQTLEEEGK